jgi:methylthioribose-1-phosphate isomerase
LSAPATNLAQFDTVRLDRPAGALVIIDQTLLPTQISLLHLKTQAEIWEAIKTLRVRGAPAIGVAAAGGLYLAARELADLAYPDFRAGVEKAKDYLDSSRPTAVNLSWALRRMLRCLDQHAALPVPQIVESLYQEAEAIRTEDIQACRAIGEHGLTLIQDNWGILTHCNAGRLAAVRYGTATAPLYLGHERGMRLHVFVDETRPLLQGARLTAFELSQAGLDVTLICDNMAAWNMKNGRIQAVFVGCDRVAANGDVANKIGTLSVALCAHHYGIPFYVAAPTSTIDLATPDGGSIRIEERQGVEITDLWYRQPMAPAGIKTSNPAFDVTDQGLVTAFVTEKGVVRPPFQPAFREILSV